MKKSSSKARRKENGVKKEMWRKAIRKIYSQNSRRKEKRLTLKNENSAKIRLKENQLKGKYQQKNHYRENQWRSGSRRRNHSNEEINEKSKMNESMTWRRRNPYLLTEEEEQERRNQLKKTSEAAMWKLSEKYIWRRRRSLSDLKSHVKKMKYPWRIMKKKKKKMKKLMWKMLKPYQEYEASYWKESISLEEKNYSWKGEISIQTARENPSKKKLKWRSRKREEMKIRNEMWKKRKQKKMMKSNEYQKKHLTKKKPNGSEAWNMAYSIRGKQWNMKKKAKISVSEGSSEE